MIFSSSFLCWVLIDLKFLEMIFLSKGQCYPVWNQILKSFSQENFLKNLFRMKSIFSCWTSKKSFIRTFNVSLSIESSKENSLWWALRLLWKSERNTKIIRSQCNLKRFKLNLIKNIKNFNVLNIECWIKNISYTPLKFSTFFCGIGLCMKRRDFPCWSFLIYIKCKKDTKNLF
jgi:hypothetical protein